MILCSIIRTMFRIKNYILVPKSNLGRNENEGASFSARPYLIEFPRNVPNLVFKENISVRIKLICEPDSFIHTFYKVGHSCVGQ